MPADQRVAVHPATAGTTRNVMTVASGKGGVGKTWLAITLAHALARQGRRTLLFDGDFGLANVDVQLNLTPTSDLTDVVSGRADLIDSITNYADGGFDIVAGSSGSGALSGMKSGEINTLHRALLKLAGRYDHVLVDMGAGIDAAMQGLTRGCGPILIVATDEPTSLTDAYAYLKLSLRAEPQSDHRLIVNMAADRPAGERTYNALATASQNFLQYSPPLLGIVRRDAKVPDAIRRQQPLLRRHPATPAADDINAIADAIIRTS